jgi:hypothetical protein
MVKILGKNIEFKGIYSRFFLKELRVYHEF